MSRTSLFRDLSIRRKLTLITVLSVSAALLFAALITMAYQWFLFRAELEKITHSQASIVASNSTSALVFSDPESASQTLGALGDFDNIEFAMLHGAQGNVFATFVPAGRPAPPPVRPPKQELHRFTTTHLDVFHPLFFEDEWIGTLHVRSSLAPIYRQMGWSATAVAVATLGGLGLALLLIAALHPAITGPIARLVDLMGIISSEKNYALRADAEGGDELATLACQFNDMLAQIQARDTALAQHRAQLEQDVAQRTASLNEAQHIAHLGSWEWDIANNILSWSDEIYRIFGLAPQQFEATYDAFMQLVHPDDRPPVEEGVRRAIEQGQAYSQDHRIQRSDGSVRHVHEQGEVTLREAGHAIRMVGTVMDITERKQFEINLRQRTAFFEALVTTSADGILVVDSQGRKILQNRRMAELLKIPEEIAAGPDDGPQLKFVTDQVVDPQQFGDKVRYLYDHPEESSRDEVVLKDGTILDRYSAPVLDVEGHSFGRIWSFRDITERKRTEDVLRASELAYRTLAQNLPGLVYRVFVREGYRMEAYNEMFPQVTGYTADELKVGKVCSIDPLILDEDRAGVVAKVTRAVAEDYPFTVEYRLKHKNGGIRWMAEYGQPVYGTDGEALYIDGVIFDITERKQAAQALEESERKFRAIVDAAADGILVMDLQTRKFVIANRAICDMLGYPMEEVYRLGVEEIHPAEALADVQKTFERQLKGEMRMAQNMPVKRKDGSVFFADVSASPIMLQGREFLVGAFHDVTDRMRAEERIRDSEARYRNIFENANDIIFLLNTDGTFHSMSPSVEWVAGWTAEEWIGKPFVPLVHADDLPVAHAAFQKTLAGESISNLRLRIAKKTGEYFSADLNTTPLGRDLIMGIARDVSERERAEMEIRKLNEELESKVKERTRQLLEAQEDLVRKEKLAVLGQVAGSVGHELRNPLGVMNNAVYFLQTVLSDADETTKEYLDIIKDEIAGSERIVSDLLDSVRTKPPQPVAVTLAELIGQTLRKYIVPDSVAVKLDIPATLSPLRVDPQQIHQVFRNLISNGVEAMAEGGVLEIRALENKADETIVVSVQDCGIGMTPEQMARLFQPLYTTKARGIGLGMVVVKNLTEANGGKVEIQSEQGRGTTVSITLPCVAQPVEEA